MNINKDNIGIFQIILTQQCNANCSYCVQGIKKNNNISNPLPIKKIIDFFPKNSNYSIGFYGGEPLLKFNTMIDIAKRLKNINPNIKFVVTTNGLLLTEDKVKILNDLGFRVSISHDGENHSILRGLDPLKDNGGVIADIQDLNFMSTITSLNWNYYDIWEYFEKYRLKYGIKQPKVSHSPLKDIKGVVNNNLFIYKNKNFEIMLDNVISDLKIDILSNNKDSYVYSYFKGVLGSFYTKEANNIDITPCKSSFRYLTIDLQGNIYNCHNDMRVCSNINDMQFNPISDIFYTQKECKDCVVRKYCDGGCPLLNKDKIKYYCYFRQQEWGKLLNMLNQIVYERSDIIEDNYS